MDVSELNGRYEGLVPLVPVALPHGRIEAILDTGFDGALMLPAEDYDHLPSGKEWEVEVTTANGASEISLARRVRIPWLGGEVEVLAVRSAGPFILAGMRLIESAEVLLVPGAGVLRIRPRPDP